MKRFACLAPLILTLFLAFFLTKPCHAEPMRENTAIQKHIESIVNAYGSSIDTQAALHVYAIIVDDYHDTLGTIEKTTRKEAIDNLVEEKINQIESASPEEKLLIWEQDVAISQLIPLSRSALKMATDVKNGKHLSPDQKHAAAAGIDALNQGSLQIQDFPDEIRTSLGEIISESLLDFSYALEPETSAQSLRLNQQ